MANTTSTYQLALLWQMAQARYNLPKMPLNKWACQSIDAMSAQELAFQPGSAFA